MNNPGKNIVAVTLLVLQVACFSLLHSSLALAATQTTQRSITVTNNTGEDIWLGVTTASVSCATSPAGGNDSLCPTQAAGSCGNGGITCIGGPNNTNAGWCGDYPWDKSTGFCYQPAPTVANSNDSKDTQSLKLSDSQSLTLTSSASTPTNVPFAWSGNMFARTGCASGSAGSVCQAGDCGAASSSNGYDSGAMCPPGAGGTPQGTLAEVTMSNPDYVQAKGAPGLGPDYYDVSIINGVNVSATIGPVNGKTSTSDPYTCTTAGSTVAQGDLLACDWSVVPVINSVDYSSQLGNVALPAPVPAATKQQPVGTNGLCPNPGGGSAIPPNADNYCQCDGSTTGNLVYPNSDGYCPLRTDLSDYPNADGFFAVCENSAYPNSYGYCTCTTSADCTAQQSCGVAQNASVQQFTQACGTFIGWNTFDTLCSANQSANNTPFLKTVCNKQLSSGTVTDYLGCTGTAAAATSCYNDATVTGNMQTTCCGCATSAAAVKAYPNVWPTAQNGTGPDNGCYGNSSDWNTDVQSMLVYLKEACPTAYVYPFDDATSTFTCNSTTATPAAWPAYKLIFGELPVAQ